MNAGICARVGLVAILLTASVSQCVQAQEVMRLSTAGYPDDHDLSHDPQAQVFVNGVDPATGEPIYPRAAWNCFPKYHCTVQLMGGAMTADSGVGADAPSFNYSPVSLRFGVTLDQLFPLEGLLRASYEPMIDITGASVWDGFGNYFVGPSFIIRRNILLPDAPLIPYIQGGVGFVFTDAYEDMTQDNIGQEFEFALQAGIGLRYMIKPNLSLDIEGQFMHISNADLADRNAGINAVGGMLGFTYYYSKIY